VHDCPGCLFCYPVIFQPVAYTEQFFGDNSFWFNADFVNTFFYLCHHHTHDTHQCKILYRPVLPIETDSVVGKKPSPSILRIPPCFDFTKHTTTLIHFLLRDRHYIVIIVDIPTRTVELIDGFWTRATKRIIRANLDKSVNYLMCNVGLWPSNHAITWTLDNTSPHYNVTFGSVGWKVKYKNVPPQTDSNSCGPRACSAAATLFFPEDPRSNKNYTGWSRKDVLTRYQYLLRHHKNDISIGLSIRSSRPCVNEHPKDPVSQKLAAKRRTTSLPSPPDKKIRGIDHKTTDFPPVSSTLGVPLLVTASAVNRVMTIPMITASSAPVNKSLPNSTNLPPASAPKITSPMESVTTTAHHNCLLSTSITCPTEKKMDSA
jgi:hypothetical protein